MRIENQKMRCSYPTDLLSQKSQEAALHRREIQRRTRDGFYTFADLLSLSASDRILGRTRLKNVLRWLPRIGSVKVQRILQDTGIDPKRRMSALSDAQQRLLLNHLLVTRHTTLVMSQRLNGRNA